MNNVQLLLSTFINLVFPSPLQKRTGLLSWSSGFYNIKEEDMVLENVSICTSRWKLCADVIVWMNHQSPVWTHSLTHLGLNLSTPRPPLPRPRSVSFSEGAGKLARGCSTFCHNSGKKWGRPTANHCTLTEEVKKKASWKRSEDGWDSKGKHKCGGGNWPIWRSTQRSKNKKRGEVGWRLQKRIAFTKGK